MGKVSVKSMSPEERREYMREIGRRGGLKGGKTRAKQFTSASQRAARRRVSSESCRRNGAKGAARTIELHGYKALFEGSRRKRLANPSPCELTMMGLLKTLGLKYRREYVLGGTLYTLDFYLAKHRLGIEVDGSIHDPGKPDEAKRIQHAEHKAALCRCLKIKLIRIHHSELRGDNLDGVISKIEEIAGVGRVGKRSQQRTGMTSEPPMKGAVVAESGGRPDF
jgi:very-short-patch-repair endonuclease